jgi:hypothetical protein
MHFKTHCLMAIAATAPFGIALVAAPAAVAALYGMTTDAGTLLMGRYFGGMLLTFAGMAWSLRHLEAGETRRSLALGIAVSTALGALAALQGTLSGTVNALGWTTVATYAYFAAAWAAFAIAPMQRMRVV